MEPKLRFPEFRGKWSQSTLNQLLSFKNGINASKEQYGHGKKFINVLDILNNDYIKYDIIKDSVSVDPIQEDNYRVEYGDLLFLRSSETREDVGKCNVYLDENAVALFGGFVIRGKKNGEYDPFFLKLLLNSSNARNQISSKSGGSTRYNVSQEILESIVISLPNTSEQMKVSQLFMLLNRKIIKQQEKIEQLELFKKGMLQKIFSQETRFKDEDGQDFPVWWAAKLGDLGETYGGLSGKTKDDFGDGESLFITYMNVFTNTIAKVDGVEKVSIGANENQHEVKAGDILFTTSSETPEEVGMASVWNYEIPNVYLNSFCFGFRVTKPVDPIFLAYLLRSGVYRKHITMLAQGSTRFNLSKRNLMEMEVSLPESEEQKLIREFFIKLDSKLEMETEKLNQLGTMKRSLMQQMFV